MDKHGFAGDLAFTVESYTGSRQAAAGNDRHMAGRTVSDALILDAIGDLA
jgi:hypothetical protein